MIQMIGIDHNAAPAALRSVYTFRKQELLDTMQAVKEELEADGVLILSTCNRMELWLSVSRTCSFLEILGALNRQKCLAPSEHDALFCMREGEEAVEHLFYLTCGLRSAILGEDQIVTQVGEALSIARGGYLTDGVLEVLFRQAVTAAKKVKTEVVFSHADQSAIARAITLLSEQGVSLAGKRCMVIGNGAYGKLVAQTLVKAGARVTVTVRQYHSGMVLIPEGCERIHYGEKMEVFPHCDLVVSATTSPNYTLFYEQVAKCRIDHSMILMDFAVPADIEPTIRSLPGITMYDIDDFRSSLQEENQEALLAADVILKQQMEDFFSWLGYREVAPSVEHIRDAAVRDIHGRIDKCIHTLPLEMGQQQTLFTRVDNASGKVVAKLLFTLRDTLDESTFRQCVHALEDQYARVEGNTEGGVLR